MGIHRSDMGVQFTKRSDEEIEACLRKIRSVGIPDGYVGLGFIDGKKMPRREELQKVYDVSKSALEHCSFDGCSYEELKAEVERLKRLLEQEGC